MNSSTTRGMICIDGPEGIVYRLCGISCTIWEDDHFEYRFAPDYRVIDLLGPPDFQGIPGIDLELRQEEYIRRDRVPVFIAERSPAPNREDMWNHLDGVGLDRPNRLEWLIRTDRRYIGDKLYVSRTDGKANQESVDVDMTIAAAVNVENALRKLLGALACGQELTIGGDPLDDGSRKPLHDTLLALLTKGHAFREARRSSKTSAPQGRKRLALDGIKLQDTIERYERREVSAKDAAEYLGIGEATFYRRLKEHRESQ